MTNSSNGVIALDNIHFSPKTNGKSIDETISPDIEHGVIKPAISCDFETEKCDWKYTNRASRLSLEHESGPVYSAKTAKCPANDHTKLTAAGYFTFIESDRDEPESREFLSLEIDSVTAAFGGCIKFWYYIFGSTKCVLSLFSETGNSNQTLLWTRKESYIRNWNYAQVSLIVYKSDLKIFFSGITQKCAISIDDVSFSVEPCPANSICDFENDNCGFDNEMNRQATPFWKRMQSKQIDPEFTDHTYGTDHGTVMTIDNTQLGYGDYATLLAPQLDVNLSCISFAFFVSDSSGLLSLQKKINAYTIETLWANDYPSDGWEFIRLPFKTASDTLEIDLQFVYSIDTETSISSIVALDDIVFTSSCESPPSCNFETDLCSWKVIWERENLFYRGNGRIGRFSPSQDMTLGTDSGHYIYIEEDDYLRGSAYLESPFIYYNGTHCLSFWLFTNGVSSAPEIDVIAVSYNGEGKIVTSLLDSNDSKSPTRSWFPKFFHINSSKPIRIQVVPNLAEKDATLLKPSFLAIDDVLISKGNCTSLENSLIDESTELLVPQTTVDDEKVPVTDFSEHPETTVDQKTEISIFSTEKIDSENSLQQAKRSFSGIGSTISIILIILAIISTIFYKYILKNTVWIPDRTSNEEPECIDGMSMTVIAPARSENYDTEPEIVETITNDTRMTTETELDYYSDTESIRRLVPD